MGLRGSRVRRKSMDPLWRVSCREGLASKGEGQGQGPGPGEEGRKEKGERLEKRLQGQAGVGPGGQGLDLFKILGIFQAARCHNLISPFLFKIPLGPVCRID